MLSLSSSVFHHFFYNDQSVFALELENSHLTFQSTITDLSTMSVGSSLRNQTRDFWLQTLEALRSLEMDSTPDGTRRPDHTTANSRLQETCCDEDRRRSETQARGPPSKLQSRSDQASAVPHCPNSTRTKVPSRRGLLSAVQRVCKRFFACSLFGRASNTTCGETPTRISQPDTADAHTIPALLRDQRRKVQVPFSSHNNTSCHGPTVGPYVSHTHSSTWQPSERLIYSPIGKRFGRAILLLNRPESITADHTTTLFELFADSEPRIDKPCGALYPGPQLKRMKGTFQLKRKVRWESEWTGFC